MDLQVQDSADAQVALPLGPPSSDTLLPQSESQDSMSAARTDNGGDGGGAATASHQQRRTTEQDEAIVSRIEDSLYQDYSQVTPEDVAADLAAASNGTAGGAARGRAATAAAAAAADGLDLPAALSGGGGGLPLIFPIKLHEMLSDPDAEGLVSWLPHGRAWKILDASRFARSTLLSRHFRHGNFRSFMRLVSGWGFRRVERGQDSGSYYHQLFLRGMTHLCASMSRTAIKTRRGERRSIFSQLRGVTPDFYRISEQFPVPAAAPLARRRTLALRDAVPDGTSSSSSLLSVASAAAAPPPVVSSQDIAADTVTSFNSASSSGSVVGFPASVSTSTRRENTGSLTNSDWDASNVVPPRPTAAWVPNAVVSGGGEHPVPPPAGSSSSSIPAIGSPDSPTSVMSSSPALGGPPPRLEANQGPRAFTSSLARARRENASPAELATAALQRYIANNAISAPTQDVSQSEESRVSSANGGGVGAGSSGGSGLALAGGSEVFLRRLRERADLIENLRSIMRR